MPITTNTAKATVLYLFYYLYSKLTSDSDWSKLRSYRYVPEGKNKISTDNVCV